MAHKPSNFTGPTAHVCWSRDAPFTCPLCERPLQHAYNDGGRLLQTLKGPVWVVTNYYRCTNRACDLHAAFPAARENALHRKKFGLDVWAKVVTYHFELHLNYEQIKGVLWHDWQVRVSKNAVRDMCEQFEVAAARRAEREAAAAVRANGRIVLALDGAQPDPGEPSLWAFTDRLTGKVLLTRVLTSASVRVLGEIFGEIQARFNAPICAVLSDRQESIVQAVEQFLPGVPHAFCHYHFLRNMARPAAARDAALKAALREGAARLVGGLRSRARTPGGGAARALAPLVEEIRCATSARGDRIRVFPGLEIFASLEHVRGHLVALLAQPVPAAARGELERLQDGLAVLLEQETGLNQETAFLAADLGRLRAILGRRGASGAQVRERVDRWRKVIEARLVRRGLPIDPGLFTHSRAPGVRTITECWQECLRVLATHERGLFVAYDTEGVDFTNNAQEQLFARDKAHFRSLYGRKATAPAFQAHAPLYSHLVGEEWRPGLVREVLLACDEAYIASGVATLRARYAMTRREWRIRLKDTGNWTKLAQNLADLGKM